MSQNNIQDIYTLSPLQEGLLFHSLYSTESDTYLQQLCFTIRGQLDVSAFKQAWQQVIARHTILRTAFSWDRYEKLLQVVRKQVKLPWREFDCRELAPEAQQEYLSTLLKEDRSRRFDLSKAPILRMTVVRFADESYELFCTLHHLLTDGWSTANVIKEVFAFYNAACEGRKLNLEPARPYRDYIQWLQQQDTVEAELFWRDLLKGFAAPTPLIGESAPSENIEIQKTWLSRETTAKLQDWVRQLGITMNTLLVGAWSILLSRYSDERDVVFGITVAGRPAALSGVEAMVGPFINTLPMRVQLPSATDLIPWLQSLQTRLLEISEYSYIPLAQIQRFSDVPRGVPLFESMLVFENYPIRDAAQGLSRHLESVSIHSLETSNYPLGLIAAPGPKLYLQIGYDSRRFSFDTVGRMLGHLEALLESMPANPEQRLASLSILTAAEKQQLLVEWNPTGNQASIDNCLHQLFEEQAALTPAAIAVVCEDQFLSYRDLNNRANQLAHYLRAQQVGPDEHVGICCERSLEMIVGILGILKAGAAYVPMDPGYPPERLRYMLEDAQIRLLLTQKSLLERISTGGTQVVRLDADWELIARYPSLNPHTEVTADNTAYVIYTSGSTGQPKGVMIPHRGICNTLLWRRHAFSLSESDRIFQNLSFAFDASVWQIFGALLNGAQLILARPDYHHDTNYLREALIKYGITITDFPPSLLQVLLSERGIERWTSLRHLFCGGEAMRAELQEQFFTKLNAQLHNVYGPTETAVDAAFWTCERNDNQQVIPIGRPIDNKQIYLLDSQLQPVPVGVKGQLCIAGGGLARGYLNHPAATGEKFIPHPFSTERGARLYLTGDMARFLPDGNIEFLGRDDGQVKIRGFRLELGEVEAALLEHEQVTQAVAVAREHARGEKRLVAYVVPQGGATLTSAELGRYLLDRLPPYMLPSAFVQLESLPLTANGKVDRSALPAPELHPDESDYVGPRTPVEEVLCDIWAKLLRVEQVGINDNFFELGGDSILSIQVCVRAREAGLQLVPKNLFEHPTVATLAEVATKETGIWVEPDLVNSETQFPLATLDPQTLAQLFGPNEQIVDLYPLSPMQEGLLFHWLYARESRAYFLQASCRLVGSLDVKAFQRAWQTVVDRHAILRTTFRWEGLSKPLQAIHETVTPEWVEEDWRGLTPNEQEANWKNFLRRDCERGFDLSQPPLTRLALMQTGAEDYLFAWGTHHILLDGWSNQFVMNEVFTLYEAYRQNKEFPLPTPASYRNYIAWLLRQDLSKAEAFWRHELKGFTEPTILGIDRGATGSISEIEKLEEQTAWLSEELTNRLESLARSFKLTLNNVVQGAWGVLLSRYSGAQDVVFGSTSSGRSTGPQGIETMVGLFVNTLPVRVQVKAAEWLRTYLTDVQQRQSRAQEFEYSPLSEVQRWSEIAPGMSLFESLVVFQNHPMDARVRGVESSLQISESGGFDRTHYTLTLTATPGRKLRLMLEYDCQRFERESMSRLLGHLTTLLEGMTREPNCRLQDLALLPESERKQILLDWTITSAGYPADKCIHELFAEQAERTPEATALVFEAETLTYAELNERANQVGRHLKKLGVGPERLVGLCVERSIEMVVGLLGILKAGGVYVPLDPAYPQPWLASVLEDAQVAVLLTQSRLRTRLPAQVPAIVELDADWHVIAQESKDDLTSEVTPLNLGYLIYTSGSTGTPKGVAVSHGIAASHFITCRHLYRYTEHDRVLQFASLSFDTSLEQLFPPLFAGATVVLRDNRVWGKTEFQQVAQSTGLTIADIPPSYLLQLIDEDDQIFPETLRMIFCGGEAMPPEVVRRVRQSGLSDVELLNVYGPTEAVITATAFHASSDLERVPIGRPLPNRTTYILDPQRNPVPVGVAGELFLGGNLLARGYLNRPAETAEKFVPDPFSAEAGCRLYRTGDLARYLADGNIEFLGRSDHQVKVRGFRIEPGEIEVALTEHPQVQQAVVVLHEPQPGERVLIAYAVGRGGVELSSGELRGYLQAKLPAHMVPASVVLVPEIPLTPNGKIDRRALPLPDAGSGAENNFVVPRDFVEVLLVRIWEEVLNRKSIGIKDDFFELGGHSILAVRLMSEIQKQFGRFLPLAILFEKRTVEQLSEVLRRQFESLPHSPLVPIQPLGTKRPLFFVHVGSGQVLCYLELARHLGTDQPFYGLQDNNSYEAGAVNDIPITEMARYYIDSLRTVQPAGPYILGGWSFGGLVAYEMALQLTGQGEEVPLLILLDTATPDFINNAGEEDDASLLSILANEMGLSVSDEDLRALSPEAQLLDVVEQMEQAHLVFDDSRAYLKRQLEIFKSRVRVINQYSPRSYNGRTLFFSADDPVTDSEAPVEPTRGFGKLASALEVYKISSHHHKMARGENARLMAEMLRERIERESELVLTSTP